MRKLAFVFLCIIVLVPCTITAQQTAAPADETKTEEAQEPRASFFDETTVTATGSERNVFDIATPVTVIREERINQKKVENAAELLREQPGVDVNGVGPNQIRPVIRGQRGLRVLFLEDGLRLNNPRRQTDFGEIGGLVDLQNVSSIEVVRGPASVLYGSDAIGGVMNVISKEPSFRDGANYTGFLEGRHSNAGDLSGLSAGLNARIGKFSIQLGGTKRRAEDYSIPSGRFGNITIGDGVDALDTGVEDTSAWGSISFDPAQGHTLRLRLNRYRADETGFGYVPAEQYGAVEEAKVRILYPNQAFDRAALSYDGVVQQVWADSTNIQAYYQSNQRELVNDIDIDIGPVGPGFPHSSVEADTLNFSDVDTWGLRADAVKVLGGGRHIVSYGVEGSRDESFNTDFSTTVTTIRTPRGNQVITTTDSLANAPNATNTAYGIFTQDEVSIGKRLLRHGRPALQQRRDGGQGHAGLGRFGPRVFGPDVRRRVVGQVPAHAVGQRTGVLWPRFPRAKHHRASLQRCHPRGIGLPAFEPGARFRDQRQFRPRAEVLARQRLHGSGGLPQQHQRRNRPGVPFRRRDRAAR